MYVRTHNAVPLTEDTINRRRFLSIRPQLGLRIDSKPSTTIITTLVQIPFESKIAPLKNTAIETAGRVYRVPFLFPVHLHAALPYGLKYG